MSLRNVYKDQSALMKFYGPLDSDEEMNASSKLRACGNTSVASFVRFVMAKRFSPLAS